MKCMHCCKPHDVTATNPLQYMCYYHAWLIWGYGYSPAERAELERKEILKG